jgi:hypothetical protein
LYPKDSINLWQVSAYCAAANPLVFGPSLKP